MFACPGLVHGGRPVLARASFGDFDSRWSRRTMAAGLSLITPLPFGVHWAGEGCWSAWQGSITLFAWRRGKSELMTSLGEPGQGSAQCESNLPAPLCKRQRASSYPQRHLAWPHALFASCLRLIHCCLSFSYSLRSCLGEAPFIQRWLSQRHRVPLAIQLHRHAPAEVVGLVGIRHSPALELMVSHIYTRLGAVGEGGGE